MIIFFFFLSAPVVFEQEISQRVTDSGRGESCAADCLLKTRSGKKKVSAPATGY